MEQKKGFKLNIYAVLSILTFIVMGIGSTFAYFTANMNAARGDMSVSSIKLVMELKVSPLYSELELLPTNDDDIYKAFDNKCLDLVGNGACLAYTIEINNIGQEQSGYLTFKYESDSIKNLKFTVLDNDNDFAVLQPPTLASSVDIQIGEAIKMTSNQSKRVTIVLWISNLNIPQDYEQAGTFTGQVSFNSALGAVVTGSMNNNIISRN